MPMCKTYIYLRNPVKFDENRTLQTGTLAFHMFWQMPKFNTLEAQLSFSKKCNYGFLRRS